MTRLLFAGVAGFALSVVGQLLPGQAPSSGKELFGKRCGGCHALDRDKEGPRLGGVYGRAAASLDSFAYSNALKRSKLAWNSETLDRWLTDPKALVPDNDMASHVESAAERHAIIDYLRENSPR